MMLNILLVLRTTLLAAVDVYVTVIIVYILMSWLPNNSYGKVGEVYRALGRICEPYLSLFRRIIPPIGGMLDVSPVIAIIVLQFAARLVAWLL